MFDPSKTLVIANPMARHGFVGDHWEELSVRIRKALGPENIYARIHELAVDTYRRARVLPYVEMLSPEDDSMYGSLVTFRINLPDAKLQKLWRLCEERTIWTTSNPQLRVSTHVHTRRSDLDLFFETLAEAAA